MSFENRNYALAGVFVEELGRAGLRHVCICPGSRSSPLTISFDRVPGIRKWVHLDERSAAFFALGMASSLGEPVAIVCSSGTAAANFLPAVVEARYAAVPLIVLTADRPPELVDWGALQTIGQARLYGRHVKWSANLPPPEVTPALVSHARAMAGRAFATAAAVPAGPVHLNFPFREPLEPASVPADLPPDMAAWPDPVRPGRDGGAPYLQTVSGARPPPAQPLRRLAGELASLERGIIVCGPDTGPNLAEDVTALARRLGYPVLADCLSQVRCGPHDKSQVIDCYDAFIGDGEPAGRLSPEVVIRFGALPVSKPLAGYLERHRAARHILVDDGARWRDPYFIAAEVWHADPSSFCAGLASEIKTEREPREWLRRWQTTAEAARQAIMRELGGLEEMFEGKVFSELARLLPGDSLLFAGNSMPVRDMDTFFPATDKPVRFMANRGASGIDGVVSTALGAAAASGRVVLVLGDISFYHDMNGLLAAKAFGLDATIIVINNNGGGIFSFLPQAAYEDVFEPYFAAPHGLTFRAAAELYGLEYRRAGDWKTFAEAVGPSRAKAGTTIIEVPGDRKTNEKLHRKVRDAVVSAVRRNSGETRGPRGA